MRAADAAHDLIPTIAWNGDVVLLSPELLGVADAAYHDFVAGNVMTDTLPTILHRAGDLRYIREFLVGLEQCKATCEFFAYCQGAHAGDRYFEHGTATVDPVWTDMIADYAGDNVDAPTCEDWGRKGGSHYKDGQFSKK